jgi:hypothetical protein
MPVPTPISPATPRAMPPHDLLTAGAERQANAARDRLVAAADPERVRESDQLGEGTRTHLAHDLTAVNADGELAGAELIGRQLVGKASDHKGQRFTFTLRAPRPTARVPSASATNPRSDRSRRWAGGSWRVGCVQPTRPCSTICPEPSATAG